MSYLCIPLFSKNMKKYIILYSLLLFTACSIQFKMNGTSIDYTKVKTISVDNFPNRATLVYPPLEANFNNALKDIYTRQTRLNFVPQNGDMQISGEITSYTVTPMATGSDGLSKETKLTVAVKVNYINNANHKEDFESSFSASQNFPSSRMITEVQDELLTEIIKELTETIFNKTAANW